MAIFQRPPLYKVCLLLMMPISNSACPPGEYALDPPNCTSCWPCEPGFRCANGSKAACGAGTWSGRGAWACSECDDGCGAGLLRVRACDARGDVVCAACPAGFGCDGGGVALECRPGTYSAAGVCVDCPGNHSSDAGASECVCLGEGCMGCPPGSIAVGTRCRASPKGYGLISGELQLCPGDTYSSPSGECLACGANSRSGPGASSADECECVDGFTRSGGECVPCTSGTVFDLRRRVCALCPAGEYCLGKTHHEPCPQDMYSHRGAGMCTPCRLNSGCLKQCVSEDNCSCDDGYVDSLGECRRCATGTMKRSWDRCGACPAGFECKGGADVWPCPLTTWSPGNVSSCVPCDKCPEITASRCNSTHNSVCERTTVPLGVLNVFQQYTVRRDTVDGEAFGTFAQLYVASIPRAQLLRVCDKDRCVQCFQGLCPDATRMRRLYGPGFELAFEVRNFVSRIDDSVEWLSHPTHLSELAKATMRKLTPDDDFLFFSRIEHSTICPAGLIWDRSACREQQAKKDPGQRSWVGLGVSVLILLSLAILGWNGRECVASLALRCGCGTGEAQEQEQHLVGGKDYDEDTPPSRESLQWDRE